MSMDFLEAVEQQLVTATERGVRRRHWRRPWLLRLPLRAPTIGIAAGVGAALAASALAATLTLPASKPRARVTAVGTAGSVRSYTTAGAVPADFQPESFTAVSELDWWVLGTARCARHSCTAIVRTTDGGPRFKRIGAPPTTKVSNVRFANARDGYAYGPQLWITHNGGRTWSADIYFGASELAVAAGYVYAVAQTGASASSELMRSPVGRNHWVAVPEFGGRVRHGSALPYLSGLWVQGSTVIIQSGARLFVSDDRGEHFTHVRGVQHAGDCGYDAVSDPFAIWGLCTTGTAPDDVVLSTDGGNTFTPVAQVPDGPIDAFGAASSTVAVASGQGPLFRTTNGGASWTGVSAPSGGWNYIGFTDATHGAAIGNFGTGGHQQSRLYYTTDGGASYHQVVIR